MLRWRDLFVRNKFTNSCCKWERVLMPDHLVFGFDQTLCLLKLQMPKSFKGIPTSKIKRRKMSMIQKQHKKWTITHQMCTHYYPIGGTSSPSNKWIVINSHTKDASKNEKEKLVNESLKSLAFPKPLVFELSFLVMTNHTSI